METIPNFCRAIENARKGVRSAAGSQVFSVKTKSELRSLAHEYFGPLRAAMQAQGTTDTELAVTDDIFKTLAELAHKSPAKSKCVKLLNSGKAALVRLETSAIARPASERSAKPTDEDQVIISKLKAICPPAAGAYEQGLRDLNDATRLSWRGPATEFREALREALDHLAPDKEVVATPIYKPEPNKARPTMKEKARYILRRQNAPSAKSTQLEGAVDAIEDHVSAITRSVYTRSSLSAHTPSSQQEVVRIHHWVRLVLWDLLGISIPI